MQQKVAYSDAKGRRRKWRKTAEGGGSRAADSGPSDLSGRYLCMLPEDTEPHRLHPDAPSCYKSRSLTHDNPPQYATTRIAGFGYLFRCLTTRDNSPQYVRGRPEELVDSSLQGRTHEEEDCEEAGAGERDGYEPGAGAMEARGRRKTANPRNRSGLQL